MCRSLEVRFRRETSDYYYRLLAASSPFLTGRAPCALIGSVSVFVQFVFRPRVFASSWSTAKRDQSFICTFPALGEVLHGRVSLGNPPALKQSVQVYREASLRRTGRLQQGPAGTRVSRIETAMSSSCSRSAARPAQNPLNFLARQLVWLPTARHPSYVRVWPTRGQRPAGPPPSLVAVQHHNQLSKVCVE